MEKNQNVKERIEEILKFIKKDLIEKDEAAKLALLASVAGESIFFLGPPGTAKSMVCRRLKNAFKGDDGKELKYFEYLMNQFSTPDEVFGPVSLKALENDEYKRIVEGYLPDADIVFLDEIWKASPAIHNTLLTVINEKKFHNGHEVLQVPLKALISASNELPAQNQGLEALWDRFLMRLTVNPVSEIKDFKKLISAKTVKSELDTSKIADKVITTKELSEWQEKIEEIEVPDSVLNVIVAIKEEIANRNEEIAKRNADSTEKNETQSENAPAKTFETQESQDENREFYVSDRRWKKIVHILKTSAFLNDRSEVDLLDCMLIQYCIGDNEKQMNDAKEIVKKCIEQNGLQDGASFDDIQEQIKAFEKDVKDTFYKKAGTKLAPNKDVFDSKGVFEYNKAKAEEKYVQIKDVLENEQKKLSEYKEHEAENLKSNLFVDGGMCEKLLEKVEKSCVDLHQTCKDLETVRELYTKPDEKKSTASAKSSSGTEPFMIKVEGGYSSSVHVDTFLISETPVTQAQWREVMNNNPSTFKGDDRPVETITYMEAVKFCNELSKKEGLTPYYSSARTSMWYTSTSSNNGYRLPTSIEWYYAAKGGEKGQEFNYAGSNNIAKVAWYQNNSNGETHPVKQKEPNELGLYDMCGNVWEMAEGIRSPSGYIDERGGSFGVKSDSCKLETIQRVGKNEAFCTLGFRVCRNY